MTIKSITREPHWLNKTRMADSLGISTQAFDKWGVVAVAKIGRESFYDARSVLDNRLKHQGVKQQPVDDNGDELDPLIEYKLQQERLRLTRGQADAQDRRNKVKDQELVPAGFAVFALGRIAALLGSTLDTVHVNLRRKHPDMEVRHLEAVQREIAVTRNETANLAQALPEMLDEYAASLDDSAD